MVVLSLQTILNTVCARIDCDRLSSEIPILLGVFEIATHWSSIQALLLRNVTLPTLNLSST